MNFSPDLVENQISTSHQARQLIQEHRPEFFNFYSLWVDWLDQKPQSSRLTPVVKDIILIAYVRMAVRNGSLSDKPRHYHNEKHIEDLVYRMMAVSEIPESSVIPEYGWSLLSLFMAAHDLRQAESPQSDTLVGNNEKASYEELIRLIDLTDHEQLISDEHKQLLKLMIYGSTFGTSKDKNGNIFNGNLVGYLLSQVHYFEDLDKEIAFLACDIDTANVSAPLLDYAYSSLDVYNEIQAFSGRSIPAQVFFGEMQEAYFFTLQQFNSELGRLTFNQLKEKNAPIVKSISRNISSMDSSHSDAQLIDHYLQQIKSSL